MSYAVLLAVAIVGLAVLWLRRGDRTDGETSKYSHDSFLDQFVDRHRDELGGADLAESGAP
jgi:hypothetical protein